MKCTPRNRDLAAIHLARRYLGMDDGSFRATLQAVGRVDSAGNLDHAGRARVLAHMRGLGWRGFGRRAPLAINQKHRPCP